MNGRAAKEGEGMSKQNIINAIIKISGKYSTYEVFTDWIRCMALSISNTLEMTHNKLIITSLEEDT